MLNDWRTALIAFAAGTRVEIRESWRLGPGMVAAVVQPAAFLLIRLGLEDDSGAAATEAFIGVALAGFWVSIVWRSASILRFERYNGTLGRAFLGVADPMFVVLGKLAVACLSSLIYTATTLATLAVVLNLQVTPPGADIVTPALTLVLLSGVAMSLLVGALLVATPFGNRLSALVTYSVLISSGTLIPVQYLPDPLAWASSLVSLRWIEQLLTTTDSSPPTAALIMASLLTLLYFGFGVLAFNRLARRSRREGTIDLR